MQNAPQSPFFIRRATIPAEANGISSLFSFAATRRWVKTNFSVSYLQGQSTIGTGSNNNTNGLNFMLSYDFTERLRGTMVGNYYLGLAVSPRNNFNNSFFPVGPQVNYQVTEKLSFSPGYRFSCREDSPPVRPTSNHQTWLMLTYSYPIHYQK